MGTALTGERRTGSRLETAAGSSRVAPGNRFRRNAFSEAAIDLEQLVRLRGHRARASGISAEKLELGAKTLNRNSEADLRQYLLAKRFGFDRPVQVESQGSIKILRGAVRG